MTDRVDLTKLAHFLTLGGLSAQDVDRLLNTAESGEPSHLIVGRNDDEVVSLTSPVKGIIGTRLVHWSREVWEGARAAVLSSRLGRKPDQHGYWFDALRTLCVDARRRGLRFLSVPGTTADRYLRRCSALFGFPLCDVHVDSEPTADSWAAWGKGFKETTCEVIRVSPPLDAEEAPTPLADRVLVALATQLHVLHARPNGSTSELIRHAIHIDMFSPGAVRILGAGIDSDLLSGFAAAGAVPWLLDSEGSTSSGSRGRGTVILEEPFTDHLIHWTRHAQGPWPDQIEEEFLDDLIFGGDKIDRSAESSLLRILACNRIIGSSRLVPGNIPMVSLSAMSLDELRTGPVFRRHLGRHDRQPFGVAIRQAALPDAQPVEYLPQEEYRRKAVHDPFVHPATTRDGTSWIEEAEWRVKGDLTLPGPEDCFLFAPDRAAAERIASATNLPVLVLHRDMKSC